MYYFIAIALLLCTFMESIFKRRGLRFLIGLLVFLIFFVIQAYNEWSPDMHNYQSHFEYIDNEIIGRSIEPVHGFLIKAVHSFGGDFSDFIFIYGVLIVVLLFLNVYYYSPLPIFFLCCYFLVPFFPNIVQLRFFFSFNFFIFIFCVLIVVLLFLYVFYYSPLPIFFLCCYFIVPFFPNIVQLRFFLAINVFILGIRFLDKKNLIFYGLYVLSILCHVSLVVMIPFLFVRRFSFFKNYKKANWILGISVLVLLFVPPTIVSPIVNLIAPKFTRYLELVSITRFMGTIALFLPFFALSTFCLWHYNTKFGTFKHK